MPVAADIPTDDSRDPSVPFADDFPDRFPDPHGRTHRITVPAPAPARREAHFTAGELEQQGLVAPVNDPHRFFDADLRADATLKINDKDQREHEIAAMLLERYGTRLRSVAPVNIQEGYSAGSWWRSPWTTCVPLDHVGPTVVPGGGMRVPASGARRRRAPRSARSSGNRRARHLTREHVCQSDVFAG